LGEFSKFSEHPNAANFSEIIQEKNSAIKKSKICIAWTFFVFTIKCEIHDSQKLSALLWISAL
jgi:hypothetical protein